MVVPFRDGQELVESRALKISYNDDICTLTISKTSMDQEGRYTCVATNPAGTAECSAQVTVEGKTDAPRFTKELDDRDVREDRPIRFDCYVTGLPQPEVVWWVMSAQSFSCLFLSAVLEFLSF